jgi:hypothetical protein
MQNLRLILLHMSYIHLVNLVVTILCSHNFLTIRLNSEFASKNIGFNFQKEKISISINS